MKSLLTVVALAGMLAALLGPGAAVGETGPVVVRITVVKGRVDGGTKRPSVKKGQVVRLVVRTAAGEGIHLHGYEITRKRVAGKPTVIQFAARIQGRFELELHHPDVLLAQLTVR